MVSLTWTRFGSYRGFEFLVEILDQTLFLLGFGGYVRELQLKIWVEKGGERAMSKRKSRKRMG